MIRSLNQQDYEAWMELAREVEYLFGPMTGSSEFQDGIKQCIQNGNAFGVQTSEGILAGIVAIDRENNEIAWLAVSNKYRGRSYGDKLIKRALLELGSNENIFVQTFSGSVNEGANARTLYEKNGFIFCRDAGKNPAGIDTIVMVRKIQIGDESKN